MTQYPGYLTGNRGICFFFLTCHGPSPHLRFSYTHRLILNTTQTKSAAAPRPPIAISSLCHHSEAAVNEVHIQPKSGPMPTMLPKPHTRPPTRMSAANSGSTARIIREAPTNVARRSISSNFWQTWLSLRLITSTFLLSVLTVSSTSLRTSESLSAPSVPISSRKPSRSLLRPSTGSWTALSKCSTTFFASHWPVTFPSSFTCDFSCTSLARFSEVEVRAVTFSLI